MKQVELVSSIHDDLDEVRNHIEHGDLARKDSIKKEVSNEVTHTADDRFYRSDADLDSLVQAAHSQR